jgi:hypothetical protein
VSLTSLFSLPALHTRAHSSQSINPKYLLRRCHSSPSTGLHRVMPIGLTTTMATLICSRYSPPHAHDMNQNNCCVLCVMCSMKLLADSEALTDPSPGQQFGKLPDLPPLPDLEPLRKKKARD